MKNKFIILMIFVFFTVCACKRTSSVNNNSVDETESEVLSISDNDTILNIIDSVMYVPLIEDPNFLFSSISKMAIRGNRIYIFDLLGSNSLYCFNTSGVFLFRIGKQGGGPEEYLKLWDFDVNDSNIYMYDINGKKMLKYDLQGHFVQSLKTSFRASAFKLLNNSDILFSLEKGESNDALLIRADSNLVIQKEFLRYSNDNLDDKITNNLFQESGDNLFYNKSVNDTVYLFSKKDGELKKKYVFDFKEKAVPLELKNNYDKLASNRAAAEYVYFFDTPFIVRDRIVGSVFKGGDKGTLIYDFKREKYSIVKWIANELSYKDITLPLFTDGNQIVSWMDYEIFESLKIKPILNEDIIKHMKEGGRLLVFYDIC